MRVEYPEAIYHVMDRGDRREEIFQSDNARRLLLETLRQAFEQPVERGWDLGAIGRFGVVACLQEVAVTPSELLADADLIHYTMGAREMRSAEWRMRNAEWPM